MLQPLDLIKTRFQVQERNSRRLPHYRSLVDACRSIVRLEGWVGLYNGLVPNLVGNTVSWGMYMWSYNWCKDALTDRGYSGSPLYLSAATAAGALTTLLLHPIFTVKTRLQLQLNLAEGSASQALPGQLLPASQRDNYAGTVNAVRRMLSEEGVAGLYRGIGPSLLLVSHGSIQFLTYEQVKSELLRRRQRAAAAVAPPHPLLAVPSQAREHLRSANASSQPPQPLPLELGANDLLIASTVSKVCAILFTYPYQVIRSCMQQRANIGGDAVLYTTAADTTAHVLRVDGFRGFYRGILPHILRSTPQATITLMLYEYAQRTLVAARTTKG